ncbi:MAG: prolyl oligopeptidase family serine peptidase, partial [Anaerolineaceae bacterium]
GPAQTGEEIIYRQVELISRAGGATEEQITEGLAQQRRLFDGLIRGEDWEGAKEELRQQIVAQLQSLPDAQKQAIGDLEVYAETVYQQQIASLESEWYRYFLAYDPALVLEKTTTPVLALFGGLDLQVPADPNAEMMKTALERAGNMDVTVITYPEANHLFQKAVTGSPSEYAALKPQFVDGFLEDIAKWLRVEITLIGQ